MYTSISELEAVGKYGNYLPLTNYPRVDYRSLLSSTTIFDPPFYTLKFENVYVRGGDFLIFCPEKREVFYKGIVFNDIEARLDSSGFSLEDAELHGVYKHGSAFLLGDNSNYYHWLINYAARLMIYSEDFNDKPLVMSPIRPRFIDEFLGRALGREASILGVKNGEFAFFEELIVPNFFQNPIHSPTAVSYIRNVFENMPTRLDRRSGKCYVTRNEPGNTRRRVVNEANLIEMLRSKGFDIISLAGKSVDLQSKLFAELGVLVSPHGAALANLAFASPGLEVIELQSKDCFTRVYWELGKLVQTKRYVVLPCEPLEQVERHKNHRDLIVDIDLLESKIDALS